MPLSDRQLIVWFAGNVGGPVVLHLCKTELTGHVQGNAGSTLLQIPPHGMFSQARLFLTFPGAFRSSHLVSFDHSYTALLIFCLTLCAWLYYAIYSSDPGSPADISGSQPQTSPCEQCGVRSPPIRVRHDFTTGAACDTV